MLISFKNVFESVVVHHQRVVTVGANVVGIVHHKGTLGSKNWLQDLKLLSYNGVVGLLDNLVVGVCNILQHSCLRIKQGGSRPLKMTSTTTWVFLDFMEFHMITHHLDWTICRKNKGLF